MVQTKQTLLFGAFLSAVALAALFNSGCTSNGSSSNSSNASYSYAGSGSDWKLTFAADGVFSATESSTSSSVSGTFKRDSSGFMKISITSGSGSSYVPSSANLNALEVPGVAVLIPPILSNETSGLVTAVGAGSCPYMDYSTNFIATQFGSYDDLTASYRNFFGTFSWVQSSETGTMTAGYNMSYSAGNPTVLSSGVSGTCSSGEFSIANELKAYLVPGGAIVKDLTTPGVGNIGGGAGILAFPVSTISSLPSLNGSYAGLVSDPNSSTYSAIQTTLSASGSTGTLTLSTVGSDLVTSTGTLGTINLTSINSPSNGFIEGTLTIGGNTGNLICMANANVLSTSKNTIFCLAQKPSDTTKPYSIILVSH